MADKKITELNLLTYATAAPGDLFVIEDIDGAETKAITAENLAKHALDNRTIGGTNAGDIVTIDGTQTLTNKTITSPSVNGGAALTVTSDELNLLDGVTAVTADFNAIAGIAAAGVTPTELGYVNGVTSGIQAQLNALATVAAATARTFTYTEEWNNNASANKTITQATINTACSIPSGYYVDHTSLQCALYARDGDDYSLVVFSGGPTFKFTRTNVGGGVQGLGSIVLGGLTADSTTDYLFNCSFRVIASVGV